MKKEDLEAIADLLHEWCVEYDEPYASISAFNDPKSNVVIAAIRVTQPNHREMSIYKEYETPGAATPRESKV